MIKTFVRASLLMMIARIPYFYGRSTLIFFSSLLIFFLLAGHGSNFTLLKLLPYVESFTKRVMLFLIPIIFKI